VLFVEPRIEILELPLVDPLVGDEVAAPQQVSRVVLAVVLVGERERLLGDVVDDARDLARLVDDRPSSRRTMSPACRSVMWVTQSSLPSASMFRALGVLSPLNAWTSSSCRRCHHSFACRVICVLCFEDRSVS
jgi:hypothetical protein